MTSRSTRDAGTGLTPADLAGHGYTLTGPGRLWARDEDPVFGYNDGDEQESWVADTVRNATDVSVLSRELGAGIRDWPSRYHLSPQRANIVRPLLGTVTGPVLEIGAGMGAVTRALGEAGLEVVAVEGSRRRAGVCADRCRDLENVSVVADTVQGFAGAGRFGTVVMIGVLEYSRMFGFDADAGDPVEQMLELVRSLLLPGGQLVLAIENQLGLKYFAGYPEDHLGRRMLGVEDRYGEDTAVTFGRVELGERLAAAGLGEQDWLYPFPDYKLPTAVLTDRALAPGSGFDAGPLVAGSARADHQHPGMTTFDLDRAWRVVSRNAAVPDLANSFLVRASTAPLPALDPVAWYFGTSARRPEFAKVTTFEPTGDGFRVVRRRVAEQLSPTVGGVTMELTEEPYHTGRMWTDELTALVGQQGWTIDTLADWFSSWYTNFLRVAGLPADALGEEQVPGRLMDAMPRNLLVRDADRVTFIDLEWVADRPLPLRRGVFRAAYDSLASLPAVAPPADGTPLVIGDLVAELSARVGVILKSDELLEQWHREAEFQSVVLGVQVAISGEAALGASLPIRRDLDDVIADAARLGPVHEELTRAVAVEHELREEIERRGEEMERRAQEVERLDAEAAGLREQAMNAEADLAREQERVARARDAHELAVLTLGDELEALTQQLAAERASAREEIVRLDAQLARAGAETERFRNETAAFARTVSWRLTRPLRRARTLGARLPSPVKKVVRFALDAARSSGAPTPQAIESAPAPTAALAAPGAPPAPDDDSAPDLAYYRARYADLLDLDDDDLRHHYLAFGHREGRFARSVFTTSRLTVRHLRTDQDTVVVILHEATRTGAPVLGWNLVRELEATYNVVLVLLKGGELEETLEDAASATLVLDQRRHLDDYEARALAEEIATRFAPVYAVANSSATFPIAPSLEAAGVPVVALVHEFASSMRPPGVLAGFFESVSEVVFPASLVAESMKKEYAGLVGRAHRVIPQGQSEIPPGGGEATPPRRTRVGSDGVAVDLAETSLDGFLELLADDVVLVVGAGTLAPRKGTEFFLQAADLVRRSGRGSRVRFAWIGHRIPECQWYVEELWEQLERSDSADLVTFLAPTSDLQPLYDRGDLFFLSSRLDPMPNVAIDAAREGIPVVAFQRAGGFADWLASHDELAALAVPHLDVTSAADRLVQLAEDDDSRAVLSAAIRAAADETFDMTTYAAQIDALGRSARTQRTQADEDIDTITASGEFDAALFAGESPDADDPTLVTRYVHAGRIAVPRAAPRTGLIVRRPAVGFNPLVYAEQSEEYDELRDGDPFADFLRRGKPDGPWVHSVLRPDDDRPEGGAALRMMVHGHFHYPELIDDLTNRLAAHAFTPALRLTTTSPEKARKLEQHLRAERLSGWRVDVVPNRGRDMAPLLVELAAEAVADFDLVLHVHGKKSPHVDARTSDRWRSFLWENLLGGTTPMAHRIVHAFAADPLLGLVYPEDPHLNDWDLNRDLADRMADRIGVDRPTVNHFDFPLGNMFWARTAALAPMLDAGFTWADFPEEPLPIDGTILHALERLTPFVVRHQGFRAVKTVVPGVHR